MIYFISDSRQRAVKIRKAFLEKRIFTYHSGFPDLENAHGIKDFIKSLPAKPSIAIIDGSEDLSFAKKTCFEFKKLFAEVKTVVLIDKGFLKDSRFKYIETADKEIQYISLDHMAEELLAVLCDMSYNIIREYRHLRLGNSKKEATLFDMSLSLTLSEYRVLLFLCNHTGETQNEHSILCHCFAESYRMVDSNVRAHISSINKKAMDICERMLILCEREKGYILNKFM